MPAVGDRFFSELACDGERKILLGQSSSDGSPQFAVDADGARDEEGDRDAPLRLAAQPSTSKEERHEGGGCHPEKPHAVDKTPRQPAQGEDVWEELFDYMRHAPTDEEIQHVRLFQMHAHGLGHVLKTIVLAMRSVRCPALETAMFILAEEMETLDEFTAKWRNGEASLKYESGEEQFDKYKWVIRLMDAVQLGLESGDLWGERFQAPSRCNSMAAALRTL